MSFLMKWESYVIQIGGTFYVSLPRDHAKAYEIDRNDLIGFVLNQDGNLTLRRRR